MDAFAKLMMMIILAIFFLMTVNGDTKPKFEVGDTVWTHKFRNTITQRSVLIPCVVHRIDSGKTLFEQNTVYSYSCSIIHLKKSYSSKFYNENTWFVCREAELK